MLGPSPLHRDPNDTEDEDYGCFTKRANHRVARFVKRLNANIGSGSVTTSEEVVELMQQTLSKIPSACDTVVKENVAYAVEEAMHAAGFEFEPMAIYGW